MKRLARWLLLLVLLTSGCVPLNLLRIQAGSTPTPSSAPSPDTATPAPPPAAMQLVTVNLWVSGQASVRPELVDSSEAQIEADFAPAIVQQVRGADGSLLSTSWQPWNDHPVREMRVCFAVDAPCSPDGTWQPFQTQMTFVQPVDWIGPRSFFLTAEFRDANGVRIPAIALEQVGSEPQTTAMVTLDTIARANPTRPAGETPGAQVLTAQAGTQTAFPLTGSVLIEDGICCAGGVAGSQVNLSAAFEASSSAAAVTEMRMQTGSGCLRDAAALEAPWEPFSTTRSFTTSLAINWVGFYVNVQYRDALGNLSPVYCDDISLEGSPAQTP